MPSKAMKGFLHSQRVGVGMGNGAPFISQCASAGAGKLHSTPSSTPSKSSWLLLGVSPPCNQQLVGVDQGRAARGVLLVVTPKAGVALFIE